MIGESFGKWNVIGKIKKRKYIPFVPCKCDCGTEREVNFYDLKSGRSTNCGCERKKTCSDRLMKHGFSGTKLEAVFSGMYTRCYSEKNSAYKDYGERGIVICEKWLKDRSNFYKWALKNGYSEELTIDRIDNDKGYSPDNCRWVNHHTQSRNKRNNIFVTIDGETMCLKDWSKKINTPYSTLTKRIREKGADPKELVSSYL